MLYILKHRDGVGLESYLDYVEEMIVRVKPNEKAADARKIAARHAADEGKEFWLDPKKTSCRRVYETGEAGLIMSKEHFH